MTPNDPTPFEALAEAERELSALRAELERARDLLRVAKCPECDGSGVVGEVRIETDYVSRDMATDAGEPPMEGMPITREVDDRGQCEWCAARASGEKGEASP